MKYLFFIFFAVFTLIDPIKLNKINAVKAEARSAYNEGNYKLAIEKYRYLIDSLDVNEEEVNLNLAHAYYLTKDTTNALSLYQPLTGSSKKDINSKANQQLGVMLNEQGKAEEALNHFKQAVKADPANELARYNYEMLKRKLDEENKQNQDQRNQNNQKNKDQEPSEFAKRLKAQADQLVSVQKYKEAYDLMRDGLKKDATVSTYQDYISRIKDVVDINR